jgi:hypothetical protein
MIGCLFAHHFLKAESAGKCNQKPDAGIERRLPLSSPRLSKRLNWLKRPRLSKRQSCRRPKYVDRPAAVETTTQAPKADLAKSLADKYLNAQRRKAEAQARID